MGENESPVNTFRMGNYGFFQVAMLYKIDFLTWAKMRVEALDRLTFLPLKRTAIF